MKKKSLYFLVSFASLWCFSPLAGSTADSTNLNLPDTTLDLIEELAPSTEKTEKPVPTTTPSVPTTPVTTQEPATTTPPVTPAKEPTKVIIHNPNTYQEIMDYIDTADPEINEDTEELPTVPATEPEIFTKAVELPSASHTSERNNLLHYLHRFIENTPTKTAIPANKNTDKTAPPSPNIAKKEEPVTLPPEPATLPPSAPTPDKNTDSATANSNTSIHDLLDLPQTNTPSSTSSTAETAPVTNTENSPATVNPDNETAPVPTAVTSNEVTSSNLPTRPAINTEPIIAPSVVIPATSTGSYNIEGLPNCSDFAPKLTSCTPIHCVSTNLGEAEYGLVKKILGVSTNDPSLCHVQELDPADGAIQLDCELSLLSRQVASQFKQTPSPERKSEYERILYNECKMNLGDGKLVNHNERNTPKLNEIKPDKPGSPVIKDSLNTPIASNINEPSPIEDFIQPMEETMVIPVRKPKAQTPSALNREDLAYLNSLDDQKRQLPADKQLSQSNRDTLSTIGKNFIEQREPIQQKPRYEVDHSAPTNETNASGRPSANMSVTDRRDPSTAAHVDETLSMAYNALISGQISAAIRMYKDIIEQYPDHPDALFGLATAYHRNFQYDHARKIYVELLEIDPNHKEALNNFLVLVAEESPDDALIELQKLERINPKFSPVPAQIAMIYLRTGKIAQAEQYLRRAVNLSPNNIVYIYNLAIVLDKLGKSQAAIPLYQKVLKASQAGQNIPGSYAQIQERLRFLTGQ